MKNRFGEKLDANGYAPSIIGESHNCYFCGKWDERNQRHEVYHGVAYRTKSQNLGIWVNLCKSCHDRLHHKDASLDLRLKTEIQEVVMREFGWSVEDFRREFGKSYL